MIPFNILFILELVVLDITLTFYQFYVDKKYNLNSFYEINPIIRKIIGNKITQLKYIIICSYTLLILVILITLSNFNLYAIGIITGMYIFVNYIHFNNIKIIKKIIKQKVEK